MRRQLRQPVGRVDQGVELGLLGLRLLLGAADDGADAGQDQQVLGPSAVRGEPSLEVGVEVLRLREGLLRGEDRLGVPGGELLAGLGRPGLHQQRVALDRTADVERPAHLEVLAPVVDRCDPVGVGVDARRLVGDHRLVVAAVPQRLGELDELGGPRIARLRGRAARSRPKLRASSCPALVTMFHPARPPLRWSSEANLRATCRGRCRSSTRWRSGRCARSRRPARTAG